MTSIYGPKFLEGFQEVVVSGAGFEESLMYHCWKKMFGVNWKEKSWKEQLRPLETKGKVEFHVLCQEYPNRDRRFTPFLPKPSISGFKDRLLKNFLASSARL